MISFLKRYRELIAMGALLLLPLITHLAYSKKERGRPLNSLDRAIVWVSSPIQRLVTTVGFAAIDAWNGYAALRHVRDENLALRRENMNLRARMDGDAEIRMENERLRKDLGYAEGAKAPTVVAPVIGWNPKEYLSLTIGKGSRDGIQPGMAVVVPEGVVGRVTEVPTARTAMVILVGDPSFQIPVHIQRTRARATIRGRGERQPCQLWRAARTDDIEDGDVAVTEGVELFPRGLVVGKVRRIVKPKYGLSQFGELVPAVDVSKLEEVLVLTRAPMQQLEAESLVAP